MVGVSDTFNVLVKGSKDATVGANLNPTLRYLRVTVDGRASLLVLGYIDPHPLGPIHVWYSTAGEVLRIQRGHVVGLTSAKVEWRQVNLSAIPQWPATDSAVTSYTRFRDVMPGYQFGIKDQLELHRAFSLQRSNFMSGLQAQSAQSLQWFEAREAANNLPPARFAVATLNGTQTAVYGEQCFSTTFCISWQTWPPESTAP